MKTTQTHVRWTLAIGVALLATSVTADIPSAAGACKSDLVETTPSADFTVLEGGAVVRHEPTGLEWRRCAEGMSWTGTGCTGSARSWATWQDVLQHAHAVPGWRLPNVNELLSIVERCKRGPAANEQVFPDTPAFPFVSASPMRGWVWLVSFEVGNSFWTNRTEDSFVRLVRDGQ